MNLPPHNIWKVKWISSTSPLPVFQGKFLFFFFYQNLCCYIPIPLAMSQQPYNTKSQLVFFNEKIVSNVSVNITLIIYLVFLSTNAEKFKYSKLHM